VASSKLKKETRPEEQASQSIKSGGFDSLENVIGLGAGTQRLKPLHQAQELCHDAREAATKEKRIALAKKALALSPLCADAYTIIGEHVEKGSDLQLELHWTALEAGRKAIGEKFETLAGQFWERPGTRPFMRAKLALAKCLWERGERARSLTHLREMLVLNPNDDQRVRSVLAGYMLEEQLHEELAALLKTYESDPRSDLAFSRSLLAFRLHGDSVKSRKALSAAFAKNKHVRQYLSGQKKLPRTLPDHYTWGDQDEAVLYAARFKKGWDETPGAIEWLCALCKAEKKTAPRKRAAAAA
jgi:tetratricopeptide (TPR) repeat protein